MNKLDAQILMETTPLAPEVHPAPARTGRLVVVIHDTVDEAVLASWIHARAAERNLDVALVGLSTSYAQEMERRRSLALLAAFIRDAGSHVETRIEPDQGWIRHLQADLGPHDQLACCMDKNVRASTPPLCDVLSSRLKVPLLVLASTEAPGKLPKNLASNLASWIGSIGIIVGFFWLQAAIAAPAAQSVSSTLLLIGSIPLEVGLIWFWNSLLA